VPYSQTQAENPFCLTDLGRHRCVFQEAHVLIKLVTPKIREWDRKLSYLSYGPLSFETGRVHPATIAYLSRLCPIGPASIQLLSVVHGIRSVRNSRRGRALRR